MRLLKPLRIVLLMPLVSTMLIGGTLLDSLEPHCCAGENIGNYPGSSLRHAVGFQVSELYELTSVSFNLIGSSGSAGSFIVDVFADNGATYHAPGALITSYSTPFPATLDPTGFPSSTFVAPAPSGILLQPGQIYWIAPSASSAADWALWWYASSLLGYRAAQPLAGGEWFPSCGATNDCLLLAARVEGNAVPEPTMFLPISALAVAFSLQAFRRRPAPRA
jgi:hypothetical protein